MKTKRSVLFGIDNSDFAKNALTELSHLFSDDHHFYLTLFHCTVSPDIHSLFKFMSLSQEAIQRHQKFWTRAAQKLLKQSKEALISLGFDTHRISSVFHEACDDVAGSMLKTAVAKEIETLAVGRWGNGTISRQVIGSVTYRLAQMADNLTLWVIDPRIRSRDVLVGLVGASYGRRAVDYAIRYFSHLNRSRFTLFHVIPPFPPQHRPSEDPVNRAGCEERVNDTTSLRKDYIDKVKHIANEAKEKLVNAGVPEENVTVKIQPQSIGIARDILFEMENGNHGILVIGRRGSKDIREFGLGSKANKLLHAAHAFIVCLVK